MPFPLSNRHLASVLTLFTLALVAACGDSNAAPATSFDGTDGASLYAQACARCHGTDLKGTDQGPPFLHAFYVPGHHADEAFLIAIRRGARAHHWNFGDMPPVEGLTDQQAQSIIAFIRETQRANGIQ